MMRSISVSVLLSLAACELPQLETVAAGTCSDGVRDNRWPQFEGSDGAIPEIDADDVGWGEGLVPPDFELRDQFGDPVCLWQMIGNYVLLDTSALWCGPCKDIAKHAACVQESLGDDVVLMTFITEDNDSRPARQIHAEQWSTSFGLDQGSQTPVMADGGKVVTSNYTGQTLPALLLLDQDLRWILYGQDAGAELPIRNELEARTGRSAAACFEEEATGTD